MFLHERRKLVTVLGVAAVLSLGVAACGDDDDGASVREEGPGASGGSGSGSGSASGPASGSGSGSGSGAAECVFVGNSEATPTSTVELRLSEFVINAIPAEVPAGTIQLVAVNTGEEPHEAVVVRYDGDPADIPVAADGSADEEQLPDGAVIGEIEGFAAGNTCSAAFDLQPGRYVLLCNIVEEEEQEAHFDQGMYTTFTVT